MLRTEFTEADIRRMVKHGVLHRIWHGVYTTAEPSLVLRLDALVPVLGVRPIACLGTAAQLHGFDVQGGSAIHIIDPLQRCRHCLPGLHVHQRLGAPVVVVDGRHVTEPAWTAVEFARTLTRPRALATLDAAVRVGVSESDLAAAARCQAGRRGIVVVRDLLPLVDGRAESPMESETRLLLLDGGVPTPELQFAVFDDFGVVRFYLDFAWPAFMLAAEYDGDEHHGNALAVRRDKARVAWLQDRGWLIIPITADDVRRRPQQLLARILAHLAARAAIA
ncbi:DUF559 domain-containing protein [Skermania sp. ID1734]|uniref:DUF559 domain-containing protein n=1 Tax=Skermania sp. ID1734 TaxID=2597516 RepID=UPI00118063A5|nr:DUF559 domain-containing protein [Skermania sp. ID1734]TSD95083.1 DUF559 domain-containing protein [Skermania sp. ID1734]